MGETMVVPWSDLTARRRERARERFERECAEMRAKGYSWRLIAERTGATPDECRHAARCYERRAQRG